MDNNEDCTDYRTFLIREASLIFGIPTRTLRRWFFGYSTSNKNKQHPPLLRAEPMLTRAGEPIPEDSYECLTWGEFIGVGHLAAFIGDEKVSMDKLRGYVEAWDIMAPRWDVRYPLLEIIGESDPNDARWRKQPISLTASESRIYRYVSKFYLSYTWLPQYYRPSIDLDIVVDPRRQFGSPIIYGRRVTASGVTAQYRGGDPIEYIADSLDLKVEQVSDAIRFQERLERGELRAWT